MSPTLSAVGAISATPPLSSPVLPWGRQARLAAAQVQRSGAPAEVAEAPRWATAAARRMPLVAEVAQVADGAQAGPGPAATVPTAAGSSPLGSQLNTYA